MELTNHPPTQQYQLRTQLTLRTANGSDGSYVPNVIPEEVNKGEMKDTGYTSNASNDDMKLFPDSVTQPAIYMLQTIQVGGSKFNLFYDSGCGDFVSNE